MKRTLLLSACMLLTLALAAQNPYRKLMNLRGTWKFCLDPDSQVKPTDMMRDTVLLPGTTDTNKKGHALVKKDETTHLSRHYSYVGKAWYQKKVVIPKDWKKKSIRLYMERTKATQVYVDGKDCGTNNRISTMQTYDLTQFLSPGNHTISICVDNSEDGVPRQLLANSHACTEDTQTNWNGIIGNLFLEATEQLHIDDIHVSTNPANHEVEVNVSIKGEVKDPVNMNFYCLPWEETKGYLVSTYRIPKSDKTQQTFRIKFNDESLDQWDEFSHHLYNVLVEIEGYDLQAQSFGMCRFEADGSQLMVNSRPTFLRGRHDACVFPATGHVPMDMEAWRRYFQICKGYGLNHVRFHSWCPPEAAFLAADLEGIYLQPELPFWGDFNKDDNRLMTFLMSEGQNILRTYGHHPSFVMFALGNELWGDIPTMGTFVNTFRKIDNSKLYTFGSNYYLGYQGWKEGMDFFVTCRNGGEGWGHYNTHTRASFSFADVADGGIINHFYPNTTRNFADAIKGCPVPIIGHETGQYQTYPDYNEIRKYHGVLYPYNMEVFRERLKKAGMEDLAMDFHRASGAWSLQLYKADIEMNLRTPGLGGFQLLDLQDYPGQGSAYVGILDAFMESKGMTTPKEWRQWCAPVVPLVEMEKYCWTDQETLKANIKIANYSERTLSDSTIIWQLFYEDGKEKHLLNGGENVLSIGQGLISAGTVELQLNTVMKELEKYRPDKKAAKLLFTLNINGTEYTNSWPLWLYPSDVKPAADKIIVCQEMTDEITQKLQAGASVLLMPDTTALQSSNRINAQLTVPGLFMTDYWNYRMFKTISENNKKPVSPGTLGILTNPKHPIFRDFPTEEHTNWQWFPIVKASHPFMLDNTGKDYRPIIQVIDNIERNHKLGLVFEFQVGKGKLLVCMSPLNQLQQYPEARQLLSSILQYMRSTDFAPTAHITAQDLQHLFTTPVVEGSIGTLNNISPYELSK